MQLGHEGVEGPHVHKGDLDTWIFPETFFQDFSCFYAAITTAENKDFLRITH